MFSIIIDRSKYFIVNPADSKHRVYRHSASDWFSGRQQISWDPDVAELKDDEKVDIHLFYLKVQMYLRLRSFIFKKRYLKRRQLQLS